MAASATNELRRPRTILVHAALLAVQLGFATHHVVSKIVVEDLPPSGLALVRAAAATVALFALHLATRGFPRVPARDLLALAGCAALGIAGNQLLFFHGLARTDASNASVLMTTAPVFAFVVSVTLKREAFSWRGLVGTGLALGGVLSLIGVDAFSVGRATWVGDLMIVANAFSYAAYLVVVAGLVRRHGSLTSVVWLFFFGTLWIAPFGYEALASSADEVSSATWALVGYIVLVPTLFTYLVNAWALRYARPTTVAIYIYLQPIAATALAVTWLGESLTQALVISAVFVFAGIALVSLGRRGSPRAAARTAPDPDSSKVAT